jgi:para-aminobenzoate synthetase/4-amino-4-deoxychorismate lyase
MQIKIDFSNPWAGVAQGADATVPSDARTQPAGGGLRCSFSAPRHTLVAHTPEQVKPLLHAIEAFAKQGLWCVGYLRYEAASAFDSALQTHATEGPLAWFGVFDQALPWPAEHNLDETTTNAGEATQVNWHSALTRAEFDVQMDRIHAAIAAGEFYQVNYTAPLRGDFVGNASALFERLHRAQPKGYAAFIDSGGEQVLSVSPELFFDWKDNQILARPMKGTAPRGTDDVADAALANGLRQSPKERAENVMIVDLLRNDLSRIAQPHTVKVPTLFAVQTLPTVLQMVSDVTASTRPGTTLCDVFTALFPCGSITGAPKVRAMQMIRALEPSPRGVYCGAIGVLRPGGHATFNVAIRTVTLTGRRATCGIGSGITSDATAPAEWQEWQHKRRFLDQASHSFNLLETLRLEGGVFQHLNLHLARLQSAARHFGYPFDESRVRNALQALDWPQASPSPANPQPGAIIAPASSAAWRVRLQLDAHGTPLTEKFALNSTPALVNIALSATYFESSDSEFTRFKTSRRDHYEAFAPRDPAVFDTLLYNRRGELTECTRGNIALLLDGRWVTPALRCGLLPGVGRAYWLQNGRVIEAVITLADLPRAQGVAFINALRGWVNAQLTGQTRATGID